MSVPWKELTVRVRAAMDVGSEAFPEALARGCHDIAKERFPDDDRKAVAEASRILEEVISTHESRRKRTVN